MHRFHVPDLRLGNRAAIMTPTQSKQIARVLRMRSGEQIELFDGRGDLAEAKLTDVNANRVSATILSTSRVAWPLPWRTTLYLAVIRPQRFEWAIEKATELGAASIVPVFCSNTTHGGDSVGSSRHGRWQQIAIEAAEQCGSAFVPRVGAAVTLQEALAEAASLRIFAWESAGETKGERLMDVIAGIRRRDGDDPLSVGLYIGPEGGFAAAEVETSMAAGCRLVTLGPRILRAETAAVAALSLMLAGASNSDQMPSSPSVI
jgi:16S rRNA (uracil1498-N3)-methyltransferase